MPAATARPTSDVSDADRRARRLLLLVSAAALAVQCSNATFSAEGTATSWFLVGLLLLALVERRRSRVARGLVVVLALVGAVLYGLTIPPTGQSVLLALACLGQAVPLLMGPVRQHVGTRP